jgi:DNA ligase-1
MSASPPADTLTSPKFGAMPAQKDASGQRSLASFFKPKAKAVPAKQPAAAGPAAGHREETAAPQPSTCKTEGVGERMPAQEEGATEKKRARPTVPSDSEDDDDVVAAVAALRQPVAPRPAPAAAAAAEKKMEVDAPVPEVGRAEERGGAAPEKKQKAVKPAGGATFSIFAARPKKQKKKQAPEPEPPAPKKRKAEAMSQQPAAGAKAEAGAKSEAEAGFSKGAPLPYKSLSDCLDMVGSTTKRLEITKHACDFFRAVLKSNPCVGRPACAPQPVDWDLSLTPALVHRLGVELTQNCPGRHSLLHCLYLGINKLGPDHDNIELGVGDSLLIKAIAQASGRTPDKVKRDFKDSGDLGDVAMASRGKQGARGRVHHFHGPC